MDLGSLDEQGYFELFVKLQGSGYTDDADSVRVAELRSWAKIAAMVTEGLNDTVADLFLQYATTSLDLRERVQYLVQGSTQATAIRRARLIAFKQGAWMTEARLDLATKTYLATLSTGLTQRPADTEAIAQRAAPGSAFLISRKEPGITTKQQLRDLAVLIERGLPARGIPGGAFQRDATWGDVIEPAGIVVTPSVTIAAQTKARVAPLEFRPGSGVSEQQWIEMQSMLCWKSRGFSIDQSSQGRFVFYKATVGASSSIQIDGPSLGSGINWVDRIIQAWGAVTTSGVTDLTTLTALEHVWLAPGKTGSSGSPYAQDLVGIDGPSSGVNLVVSVTGHLRVQNTNGSTRYVVLMIRSTPKHTVGSATDSQPWLNTSQPSHANLAELYASTVVSDAGNPGHFSSVSAGALRRIVYTGGMKYPNVSPKAIRSVILDSSEDWRNRYLLVVPITNSAVAVGYPSASREGMTARSDWSAKGRVFYTGSGATPNQDRPTRPYQQGDTVASTDIVWLYADTDGNLRAEVKDPFDPDSDIAYAYMALIIATERIDGSSVVTPVPVHATQVQTIDLEQPQNCGVYAQGMQGNVPRYLLTDAAPKIIPTCPPLGVISDGSSPVRPVSWLVRERLGALNDGTYEVRQKIFSQRKRVVSIRAPAATITPIDDFNIPSKMYPAGVFDQMDFRDRFVWIEGRYSSSDITIGAASQISDVSATPFVFTLSTGPSIIATANPVDSIGYYSAVIAADLYVQFEFSRGKLGQGFHSRLVIVNNTGADVYVNMTVEVSGFLGLADRRAVGQAV